MRGVAAKWADMPSDEIVTHGRWDILPYYWRMIMYRVWRTYCACPAHGEHPVASKWDVARPGVGSSAQQTNIERADGTG